jgi:ABC-type polysaccharide/polyol phosphate transport system ATPase subunit
MATISFENVSKSFARSGGRKVLGAHVKQWLSGSKEEPFWALRDVSFEVEAGTSLGLIGPNGAGKITVTGRPVALLELGSGFHPELTGYENMHLNASLMGMTRAELREAEPKIAEFADIGDYIHEPLRTYSSGMVLRLAFSIAVHSNPSVLIVDEVIGVGDAAFQQKCGERLRQLRQKKVTILCTSHSPDVLRVMCDHLLWIQKGQVRMRGTPDEVIAAYQP